MAEKALDIYKDIGAISTPISVATSSGATKTMEGQGESGTAATKNAGSETPTATPISTYNQVYEDAQSKAIKSGNYKDYFNTIIQNHNAREYAKKYYQNELASQGLNNTGVGSSAMVGISNSAINANADALAQYREANRIADNDALARRTDNVNSLAAEITAMASTGAEGYDYDTLLRNHGYIDENGYTAKWNSLSDEDRATILNSIEVAKQSTGDTAPLSNDIKNVIGNSASASSAADIGNFIRKNGDTYSSRYGKDITRIQQMAQNGELDSNGQMFRIFNTDGGLTTDYVFYYKGKFYAVGEDQYSSWNGTKTNLSHGNIVNTSEISQLDKGLPAPTSIQTFLNKQFPNALEGNEQKLGDATFYYHNGQWYIR